MKKFIKLSISICAILAGVSCTINLDPHEFDIEGIKVVSLSGIESVAVYPKLVGAKERELPLAATTVIVNEDGFTKVLTGEVEKVLKENSVHVNSDSEKSIEIQVVRVSLQPDRTTYCVIDYNRKLGKGEAYGFQSKSKEFSFITACENALKNAATDILNDSTTIKYFRGE